MWARKEEADMKRAETYPVTCRYSEDGPTLEELLAVLVRERREAGRLGGAQSGAVPPPLP